jgi:hypothetical protein
MMSAAAMATTLMSLFGHFCGVRTVFLKDSRWGKLPQFMANHIFCYENWYEGLAIMNVKSVADKVWSDCTPAGPGFNWLFPACFIHFIDFIEELPLDIGAFF